jgi:putative ABC transport system permease protein
MRRAGIHSGDSITVSAGGQRFELLVAGVVRDYASDRGTILILRERYDQLVGAADPNSIALYLAEGIDPTHEVERLQSELSPDYALLIRGQRGLREQAIVVFDRTFAVANGLQGIGLAVASIGILAALLAILLERRREFATLRALGLQASGVRRLLIFESGLLATLAWAFAVVGGGSLAWVLLRIINVRSFGWSLPFGIPYGGLLLHLVLAWVAAMAATVIPWIVSQRMPIASGLREE